MMSKMIQNGLALGLTLLLPALGFAKGDPAVPQEAASKEKTPEKAASEEAAPDIVHTAQASLAGFFAAGNTSSLAGKTEAYYQLRAFQHGLRLELGGGISGLAKDTDGDPANGFEEPLDHKLNTLLAARLRYDYFFTKANSAFASLVGAHDSSANLQARFRLEAGYHRVVFTHGKHALDAEWGAVYSVERGPFDGDSNADGVVDLADETRFEANGGSVGGRIRVTYLNAISDQVALTQSLEFVRNNWPAIEAPYERSRVDAEADNLLTSGQAFTFLSKTALTVTPVKRLSIGFLFDVLYDNGAIARRNAMSNYDVPRFFLIKFTFSYFISYG